MANGIVLDATSAVLQNHSAAVARSLRLLGPQAVISIMAGDMGVCERAGLGSGWRRTAGELRQAHERGFRV